MSRIVFQVINQASYDSLSFVARNLQWSSLSSVVQRGTDSKKVASSNENEIRKGWFIGRLLDQHGPLTPLVETPAESAGDGANIVKLLQPIIYPETLAYKFRFSKETSEEAIERAMSPSTGVGRRNSGSLMVPTPSPVKPKKSSKNQKKRRSAVASSVSTIMSIASVLTEAPVLCEHEEGLERSKSGVVVEQAVHAFSSPDLDVGRVVEKAGDKSAQSVVQTDQAETKNEETKEVEGEIVRESSELLASEHKRTEESVDLRENEEKSAASSSSMEKLSGLTDGVGLTSPLQISTNELDTTNLRTDEIETEPCPADPMCCSHVTKHVRVATCTAALKKKKAPALEEGCFLCLQCGKPYPDMASAHAHSGKSRHPVMVKCSDVSLICFDCGSGDVTGSVAAQTEPTLSDTESIRELVRAKLGSTTKKPSSKSIILSLPISTESSSTIVEAKECELESSSINGLSRIAPCGLKNLGNTCFFNSSVQMLAQSDRVQEALLRSKDSLAPLSAALAKCLRDVARTSKSGDSTTIMAQPERKTKKGSAVGGGPVLSPANLFAAICKVAPHFSSYEQQDAQELMTFLLGGIEDEGATSPNISSVSTHMQSGNKRLPGVSWRLKHVDFWFRPEWRETIIDRSPVDEDDEFARELGEIDLNISDSEDGEDMEDIKGTQEETKIEEKNEVFEKLNLTKEVFQIDLESIVRCQNCDTDSIRRETQYMLSLALNEEARGVSKTALDSASNSKSNKKKIKGGKASTYDNEHLPVSSSSSSKSETIESCLSRFFAPETLLVQDGNGFQCDKCAKRAGKNAEQAPAHDAVRRLRLSAVRDVMVVHFKRFHQVERAGCKGGIGATRTVKVETHVKLSTTLDLPEGLGEMRLVGIIEHLGKSLHGGHYVAHVTTGSGVWYRCSDDMVTKETQDHVLDSAQVYMALYERAR